MSEVEQLNLGLSRKPKPQPFDMSIVSAQREYMDAIRLCIQLSGLTEKEVCYSLDIDKGQWSRIMSDKAHFPDNKIQQLMELCGNQAPLFWLADKCGYDLKPKKCTLEEKLEAERQKSAELEQKLAWAMEFMGAKK